MIRWLDTARSSPPPSYEPSRSRACTGDENGLVLRVKPSGYKQWIQRLFIHGKRRELGLGPVRLITLAEAREAAMANRKLARSGGDPMAMQRSSVPTFEQVAGKVFAMHRPTWSAKHAGQWEATLRTYAYPKIGQKRVIGSRRPMSWGCCFRCGTRSITRPAATAADRDGDEVGDRAGVPAGQSGG